MSYYEEKANGQRVRISDWEYILKVQTEGYFHVIRLEHHTVIRKGK